MITKAYIMSGMGDSLNARDFLLSYCQQKNINQNTITVYTNLHNQIFEDTDFKIEEPTKVNIRELTYYANFGNYDLPKKYLSNKYDDCIAVNALINYSFNTIYPLNWKTDISNIQLPKKYITVNYGYDKNSDKQKKCLKMWLLEYWERLVEKIGIDCVQIGCGYSCKEIKGTKLNLVNKLSLKQSVEVMKQALFHIDTEGGLPILAKHIGVKSVVLFTATDIKQFAREGNLNLRNSNCIACNGNLVRHSHLQPLYNDRFHCLNRCAKDLTPEYVIKEIKRAGWL